MKITPNDVDAAIESTWYMNLGESMVPDNFQPPVPADSPLRLVTICALVLRNGFTVVGKSACADPAEFDEATGRRVAPEDAKRKIWPLLGYELKTVLAMNEAVKGEY